MFFNYGITGVHTISANTVQQVAKHNRFLKTGSISGEEAVTTDTILL
jgi:hypothetical protein